MDHKESLLMMKNKIRNAERGIALLFTIFALLLLMAIAGALTFTATIETSVNSNYRQEQLAYFAAKAGIEEARARMMQSDPHSIYTSLSTAAPTTTNHGVIYIVNPGATANSVQPWSTTSTTYPDDELCHDGYVGAGSLMTLSQFTGQLVSAPGVRCTSDGTATGTAILPTTTNWYTSTNSQLPYSGTSSALAYKWVRISPKVNSTASYLSVSGSTGTTNTYSVNSGSGASTLICWDGTSEHVLAAANCNLMISALTGDPMTPVYLISSLGVSPMGARKMVQAEVALQPTPPFIYGMYGTSNACPAINFNGNNPSTDSYTSANGGSYANHTNTGGDIGTNGGVSLGNGNVGGIVGVTSGACATPVSIGSNGTMGGTTACPSGNSAACFLPGPYTFSVPPAPNPVPPTTSYSPPSCGGHGNSGLCMVPGTYGNISITGALTLAPGVYNINSISMTGNAGITVTPAGAVTFNVAGTGQSNPIAIAGNGIVDDNTANDFIINYAGTGTVSIAGNGNVTAILNAPNAAITQQGNGNWFGSIVGSTISIGGNAFFHYDRNSTLAPANNGYYSLVSYREIPY
jgi:Tfp pilus assembly protein PilX